MPDSSSLADAAATPLERLSSALCGQPGSRLACQRSLLVRHPAVADPAAREQHGGTQPRLHLDLSAGTVSLVAHGRPCLRCDSAELPFADGVFRRITLYHVIALGDEPELSEACRVLAPAGELLVVGLNRCGWSGFDAGVWPELPRLAPGRVTRRLRELGMVVGLRQGAGIAGRLQPRLLARGWQRMLLPVADIVLLRAHHRNRPIVGQPRLKRVPAGLVPTALAGR